MIIKQKHLLGFFILSAALAIPYALKLLSKRAVLEPYPAIILPSGPSKIERKGDSISFTRISIYVLDLDTGEWKRLDPESFLGHIPIQFLNAIVKNRFGLNPDLEYSVKFRNDIFPEFTYNNRHCLSEKNIRSTKRWLRNRLRKHGCEDGMFLVKKELMSANLKTREITKVGTGHERLYQLY